MIAAAASARGRGDHIGDARAMPSPTGPQVWPYRADSIPSRLDGRPALVGSQYG